MIKAIFEFFLSNPPSLCIGGGILQLLLSSANSNFGTWGWALIIIGAILQAIWLLK